MSNEQQQPVFSIEKVYVKDLSLEIPNAPKIYLERETPEVNIQLHSKNERISGISAPQFGASQRTVRAQM